MILIAWAAIGFYAFAAMRDLLCRHIDDWLVIALLALWGAWAVMGRMPWPAVLACMGTGTAAFLLMWGFFAMGWMGGGDVKLSAAVFLWAGPGNAPGVMAVVALAGLALALLCLVASGVLRLSLPQPLTLAFGTLASERGVPYGIALSLGGAMAALASTVSGG